MGFEGFKEAGTATVKLASHPVSQAVDVFHVVNGLKIGLNVKARDRIEGYLEEIDGDYFDWYIVDEDNMVECLKGENFDYIDGDENVQASKVNCDIPNDGPWYLMLDLGARRYDRKVKVNLRILRN